MAEAQPMGAALQGMNGLENETGFNPWGGLVGGALPLLMGAGIPGVGIGALLGGIFGNHFFGGSDDTIRSTEDSGGGGSNPQTGSPANPPESTGSDGHPGVGGAGNVTPPTPRPTTGDVNPLEAFGGAGPEINPPRQNIPGGQSSGRFGPMQPNLGLSGMEPPTGMYQQSMDAYNRHMSPEGGMNTMQGPQGAPRPERPMIPNLGASGMELPGSGGGQAPGPNVGLNPPANNPGVQGPNANALMPGGGPMHRWGTMLPMQQGGPQGGRGGMGDLLRNLFMGPGPGGNPPPVLAP